MGNIFTGGLLGIGTQFADLGDPQPMAHKANRFCIGFPAGGNRMPNVYGSTTRMQCKRKPRRLRPETQEELVRPKIGRQGLVRPYAQRFTPTRIQTIQG